MITRSSKILNRGQSKVLSSSSIEKEKRNGGARMEITRKDRPKD